MLNIPNALTFFRILLIPVLVALYLLPFAWSNTAVTAVFLAAGLSDWLDGYLARRLKQDSKFGAFLDPVADKLIVVGRGAAGAGGGADALVHGDVPAGGMGGVWSGVRVV